MFVTDRETSLIELLKEKELYLKVMFGELPPQMEDALKQELYSQMLIDHEDEVGDFEEMKWLINRIDEVELEIAVVFDTAILVTCIDQDFTETTFVFSAHNYGGMYWDWKFTHYTIWYEDVVRDYIGEHVHYQADFMNDWFEMSSYEVRDGILVDLEA